MEIAFSQYIEENHKSAIALLEGGFPTTLSKDELANFLKEFVIANVEKERYWIAVYDREVNFTSPDSRCALAESEKNGGKLKITIKDRSGIQLPSFTDLQIIDEWHRLISSDISKRNPSDHDDQQYNISTEYDRKTIALACDKFGYSYEEGYPMFTRARDYLFLASPVFFEFDL